MIDHLDKFLRSIHISMALPVNPGHIVLYITHLFSANFAASTILSKISAISYWHKFNNKVDTTQHFLVQKALLGVKKARPGSDVRKPLSIQVLGRFIKLLSTPMYPSYASALYKSMLSLAFFAFLRPGELTHSKHNLNFDQVSCTRNELTVTFKSFKCYHGRPFSIVISRQNSHVCPVKLFQDYVSLRGSMPGKLFSYPSGALVTYSEYRHLFVALCKAIGVGPYTPHSPRIGGATHAAISGLSQEHIQRLGRWHSDAYKKYIRIESFQV